MSNPLLKGLKLAQNDQTFDQFGMPLDEQQNMLDQMESQSYSPMQMPSGPQLSAHPNAAPMGGMPQQMPPPPTDDPLSANPVPQGNMNHADLAAFNNIFKKNDANHDLAVSQLKEYMKGYAGLDQGTDYRPLAAFVGGLNHGNPQLLKAAEDIAPESQAKRAENLIGQQQALTKLVGDNNSAKAMAQLMLGQQRNDGMQARQGTQIEKMNNTVHQKNLNETNDPIIKGLQTSYQNLENAERNFREGGMSPQEFVELQQAVRSNLGLKGTSGVHERDATRLTSFGLNAATFHQFLTGNLQDVNKQNPGFVDQILKVTNLEKQNKFAQAKKIMDARALGHATFYSKNPELKNDYTNSQKAILGQFSTPSDHSVSADPLDHMSDEELSKLYHGGK